MPFAWEWAFKPRVKLAVPARYHDIQPRITSSYMSQYYCYVRACKSYLTNVFFRADSFSKSKRAAMCGKHVPFRKKRKFIYCSNNPWYVEGEAYRVDN